MLARVAGLVLVAALLVSASAPAFGQGGAGSVFDEIAGRLRALLAFLESVNPSEAARFREAIEKAIAKVEEAKGRASVDPEGALAEVYRAQVEALNATRGLLASVNVTYPPGLVVALDVRASMVRELNATIQYLKQSNVTVEPWVEVKLAYTLKAIEWVRSGLVSGALSASEAARWLGEINRNISDVRVYLARNAKPGWVKAHVEGFTARELARAVEALDRLAAGLLRGDPDALEEISRNISRLDELLARLPEVGLPPEVAERVAKLRVCELQVSWGGGEHRVPVAVGLLARMLRNATDEAKRGLLIAEIARCLKQPLQEIAARKPEAVEKAGRVEEEASKEALRALERAPQAAIGLLVAELNQLQKLYEAYKRGQASADEVKAQAALVLKLAEQAEKQAEKLPRPAQQQLLEKIKEAKEQAARILEELTS
mgnify:CR=1 FL=1